MGTGLHQVSKAGFNLTFDLGKGGIISLKRVDDRYDTDYIMEGERLGEVVVRYRPAPEEGWRELSTLARGGDGRTELLGGDRSAGVIFSYWSEAHELSLDEAFIVDEPRMLWTLHLRNLTDRPLELGDVALPLLFNTAYVKDTTITYTQRLIKHSVIGGHGSFIYWMRANGVGPYLVMTPLAKTKLEYYEAPDPVGTSGWEGPFSVYIHSAVKGAGERRGTWRQPHTCLTLAPHDEPGDQITYGFKFRWAEDYDGVREVLYQEGGFDVHVVPGMTVPRDLSATLSIRTRNPIAAIVPEHPEQTELEYLGKQDQDRHLFRVTFGRLGENGLTVRYGDDAYFPLEFFVTEPLETLIKKRAAFLVNKQQHRDPDKWYDGLISQWDMRTAVLRGPDDPDGFVGWWGYVLACDDTALPKAPFVAAKNVHFPSQEEIDAVEYYIKNFVWGKLQRTDRERPYPYGIYGVPNWHENRNSAHGFGSGGQGLEHLWRAYDYPHVMMLYFHMYQIAKLYPGMTHYLDKDGYLERAFGTAMAYFSVQYEIDYPKGWSHWAYKLGCYNELLIVDLIDALEEEGRSEQAGRLRDEWEKKVKYFVYDHPYPYGSEMYFDSTAFESTHAIAKYGLAHPLEPDEKLWYDKNLDVWYSHPEIRREDFETFMARQIEANLACRGWIEPAYYYLGSDYRQCGSSMYLLSYMSQMGGWALVDYALYHAEEPVPFLRLGYNSYLSSWALMNTGTPESDYGYWYPGEQNDGASGWAYKPEKYGPTWLRDGITREVRNQGRGAWYYDGEIDLGYCGALRTAATIVTTDPLFGLIALGGKVEKTDRGLEIVPRDGLRQRLHLVSESGRLHILLGRDGFASETVLYVSDGWGQIAFKLENRSGNSHATPLRIGGLPPGVYHVHVADGSPAAFTSRGEEWVTLALAVSGADLTPVRIVRSGG
jgi:hypothetical protein